MRKILLIVLCFTITGCAPSTETRLEKYPSVLAEWTHTGLVTYFPNPLPPSATNVKLSAVPSNEHGAWFQIRLTLPAAEVSKIYDAASKRAKDFYDGGDVFKSVNAKDGGLPGTYFHTSDTPKDPDFPADYRIFVFDAKRPGGNVWEHGQWYGVVVSKQRNEVLYFAEDW